MFNYFFSSSILTNIFSLDMKHFSIDVPNQVWMGYTQHASKEIECAAYTLGPLQIRLVF